MGDYFFLFFPSAWKEEGLLAANRGPDLISAECLLSVDQVSQFANKQRPAEHMGSQLFRCRSVPGVRSRQRV